MTKPKPPKDVQLDNILKEMHLKLGEFLLAQLKDGCYIKECLDFLKSNRRSLAPGTLGSKVDETNNYIETLVDETPGLTRR